jgi:hypothetical protein
MQSQVNQNSLVFIYPQWANLGMIYYFAPEIFKNVDNYYPILNEKNIFPLWGVEEARRNVQNHEHSQIIYYQDNASSNDPNNSILNFLDSTYIRKENINFPGGIIVTTFEKTQQ